MQCASACVANLAKIHITRSDAAELLGAHLDKAEFGLAHEDPLKGAIVSWRRDTGAFHLAQVQKTVCFPPLTPGKYVRHETGGHWRRTFMGCCSQARAGAKHVHVGGRMGMAHSMVWSILTGMCAVILYPNILCSASLRQLDAQNSTRGALHQEPYRHPHWQPAAAHCLCWKLVG
jgi:hypothetical protein